jgi:hypothetical protein
MSWHIGIIDFNGLNHTILREHDILLLSNVWRYHVIILILSAYHIIIDSCTDIILISYYRKERFFFADFFLKKKCREENADEKWRTGGDG